MRRDTINHSASGVRGPREALSTGPRGPGCVEDTPKVSRPDVAHAAHSTASRRAGAPRGEVDGLPGLAEWYQRACRILRLPQNGSMRGGVVVECSPQCRPAKSGPSSS